MSLTSSDTRAEQLQALAQASVQIAAAPTLQRVLQETSDQARGIIGAHLSAIHLVGERDWATAQVMVSLSDKYAPFRSFDVAPYGEGIYTQTLQTGYPLRLTREELHTHPAWRSFSEYADQHPPLVGLLAVPLFGQDHDPFGVLMISDRVAGEFTADDEAILVQLAQLASVIIEKVQAVQALRGQQHHLRATYEHASVGIIETDATGQILEVNQAFCTMMGHSRDDLTQCSIFDLTHPEDIASGRDQYQQQVTGEIGTYQAEKRYICSDGAVAWLQVSSTAVRDHYGRFRYSVRVVQDITERKHAEERQHLLLGELDHRVKNTLARVQSIAAQTLRSTPSPAAFCEIFEARLRALAAAHNLLNEASWTGAPLRSLLKEELATFQDAPEPRWRLDGPDVALSARATLSLGMVFHELATNAVRYGALSIPSGHVSVSWQVASKSSQETHLTLEWCERNGPLVAQPDGSGFGSRLIRAGIVHELGGEVQLDFAQEGLCFTMKVPLHGSLIR